MLCSKQNTMSRLRVCYNTILLQMFRVSPWNSARSMPVNAYIFRMSDLVGYSTDSLLTQVEDSTNIPLGIIDCIHHSNISYMTCLWNNILFTSYFSNKIVSCIIFFSCCFCWHEEFVIIIILITLWPLYCTVFCVTSIHIFDYISIMTKKVDKSQGITCTLNLNETLLETNCTDAVDFFCGFWVSDSTRW